MIKNKTKIFDLETKEEVDAYYQIEYKFFETYICLYNFAAREYFFKKLDGNKSRNIFLFQKDTKKIYNNLKEMKELIDLGLSLNIDINESSPKRNKYIKDIFLCLSKLLELNPNGTYTLLEKIYSELIYNSNGYKKAKLIGYINDINETLQLE